MRETLPSNIDHTIRCAYCQRPLPGHDTVCPLAHPPQLVTDIQSFERRLQDRTLTEIEQERILTNIEHFLTGHGMFPIAPEDYSRTLLAEAQRNPNLLVRREDPHALFAVLAQRRPLIIRFLPSAHGGDPYPNAAVIGSGLEGLAIPFGRGFAKAMTGAAQFVIGFDPAHSIRIYPLPPDTYLHYRGTARLHVRMVEGTLPLDDLRCTILRLPRHAFPASRMTGEEQDDESRTHLFRLFHRTPLASDPR